jgi:hypothetical protein
MGIARATPMRLRASKYRLSPSTRPTIIEATSSSTPLDGTGAGPRSASQMSTKAMDEMVLRSELTATAGTRPR